MRLVLDDEYDAVVAAAKDVADEVALVVEPKAPSRKKTMGEDGAGAGVLGVGQAALDQGRLASAVAGLGRGGIEAEDGEAIVDQHRAAGHLAAVEVRGVAMPARQLGQVIGSAAGPR